MDDGSGEFEIFLEPLSHRYGELEGEPHSQNQGQERGGLGNEAPADSFHQGRNAADHYDDVYDIHCAIGFVFPFFRGRDLPSMLKHLGTRCFPNAKHMSVIFEQTCGNHYLCKI